MLHQILMASWLFMDITWKLGNNGKFMQITDILFSEKSATIRRNAICCIPMYPIPVASEWMILMVFGS